MQFQGNSILLHSELYPAWHFWLSTKFSCCLKIKSVENILGSIQEQFYRFSRGCKPRENLWNCSRKYSKMFKTDSFLGNKIGFKPDCLWVIMPVCNRMFCCILGWHFQIESGWNMKRSFCCPALELFYCLPLWKTELFVSSRAFLLSTPTFSLSTTVDNSEATWKKATKCNKDYREMH